MRSWSGTEQEKQLSHFISTLWGGLLGVAHCLGGSKTSTCAPGPQVFHQDIVAMINVLHYICQRVQFCSVYKNSFAFGNREIPVVDVSFVTLDVSCDICKQSLHWSPLHDVIEQHLGHLGDVIAEVMMMFKLTFSLSLLLLFLGCPVEGAPSPPSPAPQPLHICPPSASNQSVALLSTCPHPPPPLYTTSGSTLQWATQIRLAIPLRKPVQPMRRRSFPKAATHRMKWKEGSHSGS